MKIRSTLILLLAVFLLPQQGFAQKKALLIVDVQNFYFSEGAVPLDGAEEAAGKAASLLEHFRKQGDLVVHVRHNFSPGGEIHQLVEPLKKETVISKDHVNAFRNTDLAEVLEKAGVEELVVCGMQTHMCLEAAVRAASDLGYTCTVAGDACATRDLTLGDHTVAAADVHLSTLHTLKGSYAHIAETADLIE